MQLLTCLMLHCKIGGPRKSCGWAYGSLVIAVVLETNWRFLFGACLKYHENQTKMVRFLWLLGVFRWVIPVEQCSGPVTVLGGLCPRWGSWGLGLTTFRRLNSFEVSKAEPSFYDDRTVFCCCHLQFQESDRALTPPMWSSVGPFQRWNTGHLPLDRKAGGPVGRSRGLGVALTWVQTSGKGVQRSHLALEHCHLLVSLG